MYNNVLAIIVTYNRKKLLKESIEALLEQTVSDLRILVVDNFSNDGTEAYIEKFIQANQIFMLIRKRI